MPLGGLYGVLLGYLVAKRNFTGRRTMELVSMINYALPGTIVGIAYLIAFNDPPHRAHRHGPHHRRLLRVPLRPTGIRATVALLQQIDKSSRRRRRVWAPAAATTFRRITLPLILPAFFAGWASCSSGR
jgi:iron(III) transport system permease protein